MGSSGLPTDRLKNTCRNHISPHPPNFLLILVVFRRSLFRFRLHRRVLHCVDKGSTESTC